MAAPVRPPAGRRSRQHRARRVGVRSALAVEVRQQPPKPQRVRVAQHALEREPDGNLADIGDLFAAGRVLGCEREVQPQRTHCVQHAAMGVGRFTFVVGALAVIVEVAVGPVRVEAGKRRLAEMHVQMLCERCVAQPGPVGEVQLADANVDLQAQVGAGRHVRQRPVEQRACHSDVPATRPRAPHSSPAQCRQSV